MGNYLYSCTSGLPDKCRANVFEGIWVIREWNFWQNFFYLGFWRNGVFDKTFWGDETFFWFKFFKKKYFYFFWQNILFGETLFWQTSFGETSLKLHQEKKKFSLKINSDVILSIGITSGEPGEARQSFAKWSSANEVR